MTPIIELSSKLFPSRKVRGCENLLNHVLRSGPILPFVDDNDAAAEERERREGEWRSLWWQEIQFTVMVGLPPLARSGGWGKLSLHLQPCFRFTTSLSLPLDSFSSDGWEWEDGLRFPTGPSLILPPIDACLPSFLPPVMD